MNKREKVLGFLGAIIIVSILVTVMSYSVMAGLIAILTLVAILTWKPKKVDVIEESKPVSHAEIEQELEQSK